MESVSVPSKQQEQEPNTWKCGQESDSNKQEETGLIDMEDPPKNVNESYQRQIESLLEENETLRKELARSRSQATLPTPSPSAEFQAFKSIIPTGI
jgi:serine phosphatase RsbU (regulator of sigma subunit)